MIDVPSSQVIADHGDIFDFDVTGEQLERRL